MKSISYCLAPNKPVILLAIAGLLTLITACAPAAIQTAGQKEQQPGDQPGRSPAAPKPSPVPVRPAVDSVAKLPSSYPTIADVVVDKTPAPESPLPAASPETLQSVRVRHLNAFTTGEIELLPPDGRLAVIDELTPATTHRLAVWDLEAGKLLRFLAGEQKPTKPFAGQENADFGAKVDFESFSALTSSPSGKRLAARKGSGAVKEDVTIYAWEVGSGRLLCTYSEPAEQVYDILLFPHDDYLVVNTTAGQSEEIGAFTLGKFHVNRDVDEALVRIDVNSGEAELLTPIGAGTRGGRGACRDGLIAFVASTAQMCTVDVLKREQLSGAIPNNPLETSYARLWLAPDKSKLYCFGGKIDIWDLQAMQKIQTFKLKNVGTSALPAVDAGLVAVHQRSRRGVDVIDFTTGKLVSVLQVPFTYARIAAISSDARRLLVVTDQTSVLVVDFDKGLPPGTIDLAKILARSKLPGTR
jgi:WD40 repeat protein